MTSMKNFALVATILGLGFGLGLPACASKPAQQPSTTPGGAPAPATETSATEPANGHAEATGPQFQLANASGELIPVESVLVPGKITVVDFYADWCAPCKVLDKKLQSEIQDEPRIAVRKIDVTRAEGETVTARYGVKNIPHVRIYGIDGALLHDLVGTKAEQTGRLAREALTSL